jgi:hypothetical protein
LELIVTDRTMDRLQDRWRFPIPPDLPIDTEVRLHQFRNLTTKQVVWMCETPRGFLVDTRRVSRKRQMLAVMTALNKKMVDRAAYLRVSWHRVVVDKITPQHG